MHLPVYPQMRLTYCTRLKGEMDEVSYGFMDWAERARHQGMSLCRPPPPSLSTTLKSRFIFYALTFD